MTSKDPLLARQNGHKVQAILLDVEARLSRVEAKMLDGVPSATSFQKEGRRMAHGERQPQIHITLPEDVEGQGENYGQHWSPNISQVTSPSTRSLFSSTATPRQTIQQERPMLFKVIGTDSDKAADRCLQAKDIRPIEYMDPQTEDPEQLPSPFTNKLVICARTFFAPDGKKKEAST
jgi:hypothetical protein